ncbi:peptidylprolyl isomerase [Sphingopyxis sp. KK2]|uniref:peptidylprolyl isomerase n=1 Tax=Sphingopyxis sp. KK2 TaxID=1855727 RepID=UPI00097E5BE9|nr:peptidylprolyl isomerase [Sphingopyxis sp. KK2]
MHRLLAAAAALALAVPSAAQQAPAPAAEIPSPGEIAAAAPAKDWIAIPASDLLMMDLAPDAAGKPRRVVIQLMPAPFSRGWIGNIRKLAAAHWWDGTSVNRVQDNYVAQWGDATEKKPLPEGLAVVPESEYVREADHFFSHRFASGFNVQTLPNKKSPVLVPDSYKTLTEAIFGWPFASDGKQFWPVHCYGMVGVGRNMSPDTGSGAELYTVIGHAPRHLDRNIALVGRVISGIEHLSSLPRGTEALGFYGSEAERVPITSVRIATELASVDQPKFEYLSTESDSFLKYADARANRRDPFFIKPAGGADICNIPVPVRAVK